MPSDRFEYDKSFEKSIAIINKIKLASSHRTAFYKQISGGPKPSGEKIRVNLAMKSVKMTSTKCMRAVILIQAKWKAMYQRKLYL